MKKILLTLPLLLLGMTFSYGQVVYEDFEGTLLNWNPFGDGVFNGAVDNPDMTGVNTSALCGSYTKSDATPYSLLITVLDEPMDLSVNNEFHIMVYAPVATQILLKLENADNTQSIEAIKNIPATDTWREYVFDFSSAAAVADFNKIIIFFDPGVTESNDTYLFDNIEAHPAGACAGTTPDPLIQDDFECQRNVSYGAGYDSLSVIANPDASGINTSSQVGQYNDPVGNPWTALVLDYNNSIDLSTNNHLKVKIWSPKMCQMLFKLEGGASPAYEQWMDVPEVNTWVEYEVDFSSQANADHKKIVIFFNGGVDGEPGDVYYVDDIVLAPAPPPAAIEDFEDGASLGWFPANNDETNHGVFEGPIANPDATGANESDNVGKYTKGASDYSTLSAFLVNGLDLSTAPQLNMHVWAPAEASTVTVQLVSALQGAKEVTRDLPATEQWVEMSFNFEEFASVTDFQQINLLFDAGTAANGAMYFFDNITQSESTVDPCEGVLPISNIFDDFECQRNAPIVVGNDQLTVVDNPDVSAGNTSTKVGAYVDPFDEWSALVYEPGGSIDLSLLNQLHIKVLSPTVVPLLFKLEGGTSAPAEVWVDEAVANEWTEYIIDFSDQAGEDHTKLAIFFNAANVQAEETTYHIDDIYWTRASYTGCIDDHETAETTISNFNIFANGHLEAEGGLGFDIVANPTPAGINTSDNVGKFTKASDSDPWAGCYAPLDAPIEFGAVKEARVKVLMDHIGNFAIKLEGSTTGAPNVEVPVENTKVNEWEELVFDFSEVADDAQYKTLTIFFDLLIDATGEDVASYFDEIVIGAGTCGTVNVFEPVEVVAFDFSPNPVIDAINVNLPEDITRLHLLNTSGQLQKSIVVNKGTNAVTVLTDDLQAGMYFLIGYDQTGAIRANAKVIKQ